MQSFDSVYPQHFQNSRLEVNKIFHRSKSASTTKRSSLTTAKSAQFIPFLQERDSLGRLLSKKLYDVNLHFNETLKSSPERRGSHKYKMESMNMKRHPWLGGLELSNKINQNPQKSLKMDIFKQESHTFKLSDIHKKKQRKRMIVEPPIQNQKQQRNKQLTKQFIVFEQPETHLRKVKSAALNRRKRKNSKQTQRVQLQTRPKVRIRQQFLYFIDQMKKIQQKVKLLPDKKKKPFHNQGQKQHSPLKQSGVEIKGKKVQHPQLQRFQKMQSLSVKLFTNFEQGHQRLIKNVKNAKVSALRIKNQLQYY